MDVWSCRSSHQKCSMKKSVLRNFTTFTGKRLYHSLFFNKVAGLRPATLLKKRLGTVFSSEFCEISKNTLFTEHLWTAASGVTFWIFTIWRSKDFNFSTVKREADLGMLQYPRLSSILDVAVILDPSLSGDLWTLCRLSSQSFLLLSGKMCLIKNEEFSPLFFCTFYHQFLITFDT